MITPESHEKAKIKKYLDQIGAWYCCPYMAGYGRSGIPDILGCYKGRFFSIEAKRPGAKPTKLQSIRMAEILGSNGLVMWGDANKIIYEFNAFIHGYLGRAHKSDMR